MAIQIYNTFSRKKEKYEPVNPNMTGFYACGPTVYDYFHIGNARMFIVFDVIRRYLIYRGYNVRYVMNLTDIDDKIIERANERGICSKEISQEYIASFFEDIQKLGVHPADVYPRATHHIDDMIALIEDLVAKGFAYESGGDVFYDVRKFPNYAKLSGKNLDDLQAGSRVAVDERKKYPLDFVLWKASKAGEPSWPSPWGDGRPGWHLECSVMSMKYLGESFDFHAGGLDLIFPHHENEIAQSEASTGKPFVRYWLHNGFLDIRGDKMSKSTGNFFTAREILEKYPATAIRLFFLQKHYRSPIDFSDEVLRSAVTSNTRMRLSYQKIAEAAGDFSQVSKNEQGALDERQRTFFNFLNSTHAALLSAMDDDFNTPMAVGKVFDLFRETNRFIDDGMGDDLSHKLVASAKHNLDEYDSFLGIIDRCITEVSQEKVDSVIQAILQLRQDFRKEKNFAQADKIRDSLADAGLIIEDTPEGVKWRWGS
ncbi:MAG: cysteine--tRNA ligase [bacterium]